MHTIVYLEFPLEATTMPQHIALTDTIAKTLNDAPTLKWRVLNAFVVRDGIDTEPAVISAASTTDGGAMKIGPVFKGLTFVTQQFSNAPKEDGKCLTDCALTLAADTIGQCRVVYEVEWFDANRG